MNTFLSKLYKLSNPRSCDSEFRIFFLNHKFWALESTYSFMLKYSEITGRIFVYFSDQRPQKMLRNLLLLLFLTTCIMMVTSEDVQEEVKKSRNPIDYYTMSWGFWKHHFGIPGVRPMFLKPKLHKESKNGFKKINYRPYRRVIFSNYFFRYQKSSKKSDGFFSN